MSGQFYGSDSFDRDTEVRPGDRDSYAVNLGGLKDIFDNVRQKLHSAYIRGAKTYNLRRRDIEFHVGDRVWRRNKVLSNAANNFSAKLAPKYILSVVKTKHSKLAYELCNEDGSKAGRWHIRFLKPFHEYDPDSEGNSSETSEE